MSKTAVVVLFAVLAAACALNARLTSSLTLGTLRCARGAWVWPYAGGGHHAGLLKGGVLAAFHGVRRRTVPPAASWCSPTLVTAVGGGGIPGWPLDVPELPPPTPFLSRSSPRVVLRPFHVPPPLPAFHIVCRVHTAAVPGGRTVPRTAGAPPVVAPPRLIVLCCVPPGAYEDPYTQKCGAKEMNVTIEGVPGAFCSPPCEGAAKTCPNAPGGDSTPQCALEVNGQTTPTYCALICIPGSSTCPGTAQCQPIQGVGVCTYSS